MRIRRPSILVIPMAVVALAGPLDGVDVARAAGKATRAGRVDVRVAGLPPGQRPAGVVRGPGVRKRLTGRSTRLTGLRPGRYTLTLSKVRIGRALGTIKKGATASPSLRSVKVRLRAGRRAVLRGRYGSIVNPGVRPVRGAVLAISGPPGNPATLTLPGRRAFRRGAILSIPPSGMLPRGVLSHVRSTKYAKGRTIVAVRAASIYEVAPTLEFDVPLRATPQARSASLSCAQMSGLKPYREAKDITFSGGWNTLGVLGNDVPIGVRAQVHFTVEAGLDATTAIGVACAIKTPSLSASGMAGPIPVTAAIQGELSASAGYGAKLNASGSLHVDAGAHTSGAPPHLMWVPDVDLSGVKFDFGARKFAEARAGLGIDVKAGIGNDHVASATLNVGTSTNLTVEPGSCTWDARFGQFSAEGKVLRTTVESPSTPALYTRILWTRPCGADNDPPQGGGGPELPPDPHAPRVGRVASGHTHVCALRPAGTAACWGTTFGSLGDALATTVSATPVAVAGGDSFDGVSASGKPGIACGWTPDGLAYCWGTNSSGELGAGFPPDDLPASATPIKVAGLSDVRQVSSGNTGSCAVERNGLVHCWGNNLGGQLGTGQDYDTLHYVPAPVAVAGITDAVAVGAGSGSHRCALHVDGTVSCWGTNDINGAGLGDGVSTVSSTPVNVSGLSDALAISSGGNHSCALRRTGSVVCWGDNQRGALGDGTATSSKAPVTVVGVDDAVSISAGAAHTCALRRTGAVACWGGGEGQGSVIALGNGTNGNSLTPVKVSGLEDAVEVSAGEWQTCALRATGAVACWGTGESGQLGDGHFYTPADNPLVPVPVLDFP
jgi:alpha-tubulin suppressor-like RCC1 family protein